MATSEILGLFQSPEQYQANQLAQFRQRAANEVQLNPFQQAAIGMRQAGYQLGGGIGGALGGTDPQLDMISKRNALLGQLDQNDPESFMKVAQAAAQMGDAQFAIAMAQEGRKLRESSASIELKEAQAFKAKNQQKAQTDSAQKRAIISSLEQKLATDPTYKPTQQEIANARFIVATETKSKSFIDPQTNQLIVIDGLDINLAAPNVARVLSQISASQAAPQPTEQPVAQPLEQTTTQEAQATTPVVAPTPTLTSQPQVRVIDTPSSKIKTEERDKKTAAETEEKKRAVESFEDQISAVQSLRKTIDSTRKIIGPLTTGYGALLSGIPLTKAKTLKGNTQTIKNNVALAKLRELKQQSSTGASGLGALNMKEFDAIQGIIASLDPESENYTNDLETVDAFFARAEDLMTKQSARAKEKLGTGSDNEAKIQAAVDRAMKDPRTKGTRAQVEAVIRQRLQK
jgi:hypothetical protein